MRATRTAPLLASALFAVLAACRSDRATSGSLTDLTLHFCGSPPAFFGYQNVGKAWMYVPIGADGSVTVKATGRLGIVVARQQGSIVETLVTYATADELRAMDETAACTTPVGRTVTGQVASVPAGQFAQVGIGRTSTRIYGPATSGTYTLSTAPTSAADLVAHLADATTGAPTMLLVRRGVDTPTPATLDLDGPEAVVPSTSAIMFGPAAPDETRGFGLTLLVRNTRHVLQSVDVTSAVVVAAASLPPPRRLAGDLHWMSLVYASGDLSRRRGVWQYRGVLIQETLTAGPDLANASLTTLPSSAYARVRAVLPRQPEYPTAVRLRLQQPSVTRDFSVRMTAAFAGAGSTWSVEIPDLSDAGFPAAFGVAPGTAVTASVTAYNGRTALVLGGDAADGETVTYAMRFFANLMP